MDHEDQIDALLEGLPDEYKPVIDQIEGRETPPTLTEIHEKLLHHEAKLAATVGSSIIHVSANMVQQKGQGSYQNKNKNHNNYYNNQQRPQSNNFDWQQKPRASRPYLGKCQICGTQGHGAKRCPQLQTYQAAAQSLFTPWQGQPRANIAAANPYTANNWLLDSGATHHITSDLQNLQLHQPYEGGEAVIIADGSNQSITHTGSLTLPSQHKNIVPSDVLCVPKINKNLISVYGLCNTNQVSVKFFPSSFQVKDLNTGTRLIQGKTKAQLYQWPTGNSLPTAMFASPSPKATLSSWHSRLGHPSISILNKTISQFFLPVSQLSQKNLSCSDCLINKSHKLSFSTSSITSTRPLEIIFSDVWSSPILSTDQFKYYLILVDHYTTYTWLYPIKLKSQVKEVFVAYKKLVENRFQHKIGTLFSDNGGEFLALKAYLQEHGISHLTSPPHTPEHNGVAERKHRHVVETGLTLMTQAMMPKEYWTFAFAAAIYLINRMPTPNLDFHSPYQKLFTKAPNYNRLRVFGCQCFPWLRPYTQIKMEYRSKPCVFLGYSTTQSAYFCLHLPTMRFYTSRHVAFQECLPLCNIWLQWYPKLHALSSKLRWALPTSNYTCASSDFVISTAVFIPVFGFSPNIATVAVPTSSGIVSFL